MASEGKKQRRYDQAMKMIVVQSHIIDRVSYGELAKRYGVPYGTVSTWVHQFHEHGAVPSDQHGRPGPDAEIDYKEKYEILKKFLAFCEKVDRLKK